MAKDNILEELEQISANKQKYIVKADTKKRDLDATKNNIVDADGTLADITTKFNLLLDRVESTDAVLGTLINDLKKQRIVG